MVAAILRVTRVVGLRGSVRRTAAILAMLSIASCADTRPTLPPDTTAPAVSAAAASLSPTPGSALQIAVVGLRNDKGRISCTLFNDPKAYPRGKEFKEVWGQIHGDAGLCIFTDIPPGKYAAVVFHDENSNGHFDQNAFGLPLEGYGFSNNAAPLFDAPTFAAASFNYDGRYLFAVINIRY
jgi:uncharacterized protein (DUF2141 family)